MNTLLNLFRGISALALITIIVVITIMIQTFDSTLKQPHIYHQLKSRPTTSGKNISTELQTIPGRAISVETSTIPESKSKYKPICNRSYSKGDFDVVPRRAYYDTRLAHNIIKVLAEVHDAFVSTVLACEINGYQSKSVTIKKENLAWVRKHRPGHTHCVVIVLCQGLPQHSICNHSIVELIYKKKNDTCYSRVRTEKPMNILNPKETSQFTRGKGSVVVCSTMFDHPPKFNEWLKYQKAIGADMVHLNVHPSFFENATVIYPYIEEATSSGFLVMEEWKDILGNRNYRKGQFLKYQDCAFRYVGVFEYGVFCDYDDFFTPLIPEHKDIHYYVRKLFSSNNVGTVRVPWQQYICKPIEEIYKKLPDGNLTKSLSGYDSYRRSQAKAIHRLFALEMVNIHGSDELLPGFNNILSDPKLANFAHIRKNYKKDCRKSLTTGKPLS